METVATRRKDYDHIVELVHDKEDLVDEMLEDPRLLERLAREEEALVQISPFLLFTVLLRRVRRDLERAAFVYEVALRGQRIPVFEAPEVVALLADKEIRDYLTDMLACFTRTNSTVLRWKEDRGWRQRRISDLDMDDMILLCRLVEPQWRPAVFKRIADIALFLSGVYPEQASLFVARPQALSTCERTIQDYEQEGQRFYGLAAGDLLDARGPAPRSACGVLSRKFTLARRALNTLSDQYLKSIAERQPGLPLQQAPQGG